MSKKTMTWIVVGFVILYGLSPYYATYRLFQALSSGDKEELDARIDFPSLRASLKDELNAMLMKNIVKSADQKDNPFAGLALVLMPKIVDSMVDAYVTPSGIATIINDPKKLEPRDGDKATDTEHASIDSQNKKFDIGRIQYAFFQNPTSFLIRIDRNVSLKLQFRDWGWKLTRLTLPNPEEN